jgi:hypothetical protein
MPQILRPPPTGHFAQMAEGGPLRQPADDVAPSTAIQLKPRGARTGRSAKHLAEVLAATLLVAVLPVAVVWWARASGRLPSPAYGVLLGVIFSLGASSLGCLVWEMLPGSEDLLFSELMLWGYLHRRRAERKLESALDMVARIGEGRDGPNTQRRAKLLEQLVTTMETQDPYLHGHSRRVARYSWLIAKRMRLSPAEVARVRTAAAVHDVGKIKTPTAVLHKPGRLTDVEFDIIKKHPVDGALMTEVLRDPAITSMVRSHHERLDGSGYPDGLAGTEIPLGARIIAVADTFDAITSERAYRRAGAHKKALDILREEAGTRLDADAVHAFCGHYAGQAPITMWSFVVALPERLVSWIGSSVGSVASAAKVAAVAALVSGAAVTSATLGLPVNQSDPGKTRPHARAASGSTAVWVRRSAAVVGTGLASAHSRRRANTHTTTRRTSPHSVRGTGTNVSAVLAAPTPAAASSPSPGTPEPHQGSPSGSPSGGGAEPPAKATPERPSQGKPEETKGKSEEAKGKPEETKGKSEETKGKSEETKGKSGETKGKSGEAKGKSAAK